MSEKIKLSVTLGPKINGFQMVSGAMPAIVLAANHKIDYRDAMQKTGYQRKPTMSRVRQLATRLAKGNLQIPTSVLLNWRHIKEDNLVREKETAPKPVEIFGRKIKMDSGTAFLELELSPDGYLIDEHKFHVIDGQHRILAFHSAITEGDVQRDLESESINFNAFLGADLDTELDQFYLVNSNAKPVRTDLALELLKYRSDQNSTVFEELVGMGQDWRVKGQTLLDLIVKKSAIWETVVQRPNQINSSPVKVPAASFVTSLKTLLRDKAFLRRTEENQATCLIAYWEGIEMIIPEAFPNSPNAANKKHEPKDFALLKGIGVSVLNEFFVSVLHYLREEGLPETSSSSYVKIMRKCFNELEEYNKEGELVSGNQFWMVAGKGGAVGSFSSGAGKKALVHKLESTLPKRKN